LQVQHIGNYDFGGSIYISGSAIYDCMFEHGMIYVPSIAQFKN